MRAGSSPALLSPAAWNQSPGLACITEPEAVQDLQAHPGSAPCSRRPPVGHCATPPAAQQWGCAVTGCRFPQRATSKSPFFPRHPTLPLGWGKAVQEIRVPSLSMASVQLHLGLGAPGSCYLSQWLISVPPPSLELPHLSDEGGLPRAPGFSEPDLHTPPALLFLTSLSWLTFRSSC